MLGGFPYAPLKMLRLALFVLVGSLSSADTHTLEAPGTIVLEAAFKHSDDAVPPLTEFSDTSSLKITAGVAQNIYLRHANALFGIPPYGGSIFGVLYYPTSGNATGCDAAQLAADPGWAAIAARGSAAIAVLDRGGCPFSTKVFNAQRAGARAALVADVTEGLCFSGYLLYTARP